MTARTGELPLASPVPVIVQQTKISDFSWLQADNDTSYEILAVLNPFVRAKRYVLPFLRPSCIQGLIKCLQSAGF